MMPTPLETLWRIVKDVPILSAAFNRCVSEWQPEDPPATIIFAEVGTAVGENLAAMPGEVQRRVFASIEEGVVSEDDAIGTAMATGLVEALVTSADKKPGLWTELEKLLGTASLEHASWWRNYGGWPNGAGRGQ